MGSSKEKKSFRETAVAILNRIPGAALLFAVVPLLVFGYLGWFYYGAEHLDQAFYSIKQQNLTITEQPSWIKSSVLEEVFQKGRLDRISLLDPSASASIAQAFETHDWVKAASRVTKSVGGRVVIDLVYRRPAAMVYYAAPADKEDGTTKGEDGFYPIDEEGVILPRQDFEPARVWDYFMIFADGARPAGDVGMSFGDARIADALKLCKFLDADRETLGLQQIWVDRENRSNGPSPWIMTLVTKDHHQIRWGHAPQIESSDEPTCEEKHKKMIAWLDYARSQGGKQKVDLRFTQSGLPVSVGKH